MKKFLFLSFLFCLSSRMFAKIPFDYSMFNDQKEYKCTFKKCYSLDEIVEKLKRDNYDVRDKLQTLIQVNHNIKVRRARMIPSFNLSMGMSAGFMDFLAVPSLLGFLFPSNWFNWKESKLFYLAQRQSFKTLLANEIVSGVELYYTLHQEFVDTEIYSHYYKLLTNIEKFLKQEMENGNSNITSYHIHRLRAFKASAKIKAILLENEFKDTFPLLANLMAMPIDSRWDQSSIYLQKLPELSKYKKKDQNAYYQDVIRLSPEVKTVDYLILAADYTKKARIFAFLTPGSGVDDNFGAGYFSQIKIVKSQKKQLQIKKEKTSSLLKVGIHALLLNHNAAIDTFKQALVGRRNIKKILKSVFRGYERTKTIDVEQVVEVINSALQFDLSRNFSQHYFFANKIKMERFLFKGEYFSSLDSLIPDKKKLDSLSSFRKSREERKIKKAIARNLLKI